MKVHHGVTRIVFVFNRYVIKIPNFTYSHYHFLQGCVANWSDRRFCRLFKSCEGAFIDSVVPSYFCTWFGLIQIQAKCEPMERDLTEEEEKKLNFVCDDIHKENFGWYQGRLVCLDYGQ